MSGIERRDFLAAKVDRGFGLDDAADLGGEQVAIDGERVARGNPGSCGDLQKQRSQTPELFFKEPRGAVFLLGFERIAAHELGKRRRLVGGRLARGAHFIQDRTPSGAGDLPGGFAARESSAGDVHFWWHSISIMIVLHRVSWLRVCLRTPQERRRSPRRNGFCTSTSCGGWRCSASWPRTCAALTRRNPSTGTSRCCSTAART